MRHKIVLLLSLLAVAGGLYLAVSAHRGYISQLNLQSAKAAAIRAEQTLKAELQAHQDAVKQQEEINNLQQQCQNGAIAYAMLTPVQRDHVVKPNCSL